MASQFRKLQRDLNRRTRVRVLTFEPDDERFERVYGAVISQHPGLSGNRDRREQRTHGKLLDKLETIGQLRPAIDVQKGEERDYLDGEVRLYVTHTGGAVVLEEEEYRMAVERCDKVIPYLHPSLSRSHEQTMTWLEGIKEQAAAAAPTEVTT